MLPPQLFRHTPHTLRAPQRNRPKTDVDFNTVAFNNVEGGLKGLQDHLKMAQEAANAAPTRPKK
eukprot:1622231-Pyramimonas_sp.AAC.1